MFADGVFLLDIMNRSSPAEDVALHDRLLTEQLCNILSLLACRGETVF